jgi:hypothetical protein
MEIRAQIVINAPKVMATDRYYKKIRQLRRAGAEGHSVLRQFNLGWPKGARMRTVINYHRKRVGRKVMPVDEARVRT